MEEIKVESISLEQLRMDNSGILIEQIAALAYRSFREPPWSDDREKPRLHFGLGVDLMRRNALAFIAKAEHADKIAGYGLGYEVLRESEDPRDLTLSALSGSSALDYLFDAGQRMFYGDTLCVDPGYRRQHIAYRLSAAQIAELRTQGYSYRIGRTAISNESMRALYSKLGFQELALHDAVYRERTYWLLRL